MSRNTSQASQVFVWVERVNQPGLQPVLVVHVVNSSSQAIYDAEYSAIPPRAARVPAERTPTAYVANSGYDLGHTVTPFRTATNTPGRPIQVGKGPDAIAITA